MQLRKKLCYFMIMVLSCCDLLVVLTSHPLLALFAMLLLTEKLDVYTNWMDVSSSLSNIFVGFSFVGLLVMNFDRYLATSYPIFHRTSVTKGKLLILHAIVSVIQATFVLLSVNDFVITNAVLVIISFVVLSPSMLFINYKLFIVIRKSRKNNRITPQMSLKNVSSCLLAVACFLVLSCVPSFVYIGLRIISKKEELTLDNATIAGFWAKSIVSMNGTFNCLIFYWKNKILRTEGMNIIKSMKICRRFRSESDH